MAVRETGMKVKTVAVKNYKRSEKTFLSFSLESARTDAFCATDSYGCRTLRDGSLTCGAGARYVSIGGVLIQIPANQ
ncbi:MAG: hypothetical protein IJX18_03000, partial [Clostridia bacterium]|nr:hypothetical protein [Clostridia bacterium]